MLNLIGWHFRCFWSNSMQSKTEPLQKNPWNNQDLIIVLFLLSVPLLFFIINPNIFFLNSIEGAIDPWGYLGYFTDLSTHIDNFVGGYPASRLGWTLLGSLIYSTFPPIAANIVLRLFLYYGCTLPIFVVIRDIFQNRWLAFSISIFFCSQPAIWFCLGRDYTDAGCILYTEWAIGLIYLSHKYKRIKNILLIASGASIALLISTHFFTIVLFPSILLCIIHAKSSSFFRFDKKIFIFEICLIILGSISTLLILSLISFSLGGQFLFLSSSISFARNFSKYGINPWLNVCKLQFSDYWIPVIFTSAVLSFFSAILDLRNLRKTHYNFIIRYLRNTFFRMNYILILSFFILYEFQGGCVLRTYFSMLLPFSTLAIAESLYRIKSWNNKYTYQLIAILSCAQACSILFYARLISSIHLDKLGIQESGSNLNSIVIAILFLLFFLVFLSCFTWSIDSLKLVKKHSITFVLTSLILFPLANFSFDGYFSSGIYSNFDQYQSLHEVVDYLRRNHSLIDSIFWYDIKSPIGNHYRSIVSITFFSKNLINENFPYYSDFKNRLNDKNNSIHLIDSSHLDLLTSSREVNLLDSDGNLNPQTGINPGRKIVILSDLSFPDDRNIQDSLANLGLGFKVEKQKPFQIGSFKFQVKIGSVSVLSGSEGQNIFSCVYKVEASSVNPLSHAYPNSGDEKCVISGRKDQISFFDVLTTESISVMPQSKYLISLSEDRLNPFPSDSKPLESPKLLPHLNFPQILSDIINPDLSIFNEAYCSRKYNNQNKQFIFGSGNSDQAKISLLIPLNCPSTFLDQDNFLKTSKLSISKLLSPSTSQKVIPVFLSQNLIRDWWRVRFPTILSKKVDFNQDEQAFELVTNKTSTEDFQVVSPTMQLLKDATYVVSFSYKVKSGGFSFIAIADDDKTKLLHTTFCESSAQNYLLPMTMEFNSKHFKTVRLILAQSPSCFSELPGQSDFLVNGVTLGQKVNRKTY